MPTAFANVLKKHAYKQYDQTGTPSKVCLGLGRIGRLAPNPDGLFVVTPSVSTNPQGSNVPLSTVTRDLVHRFYQNQMQIDGGKNEKVRRLERSSAVPPRASIFTSASQLPMWKVAQHNVLLGR